ncbi:hypothetical protein JCM6882_002533 [Rhodosporidiobolus microsporus]
MESLSDEWTAFIDAATTGRTALSARPRKPALLHSTASWPVDAFDTRDLGPIPAPPGIGTPERVRETFEREGWMPAPVGPWEDDRLRVLRRFGLQDAKQVEAVDKIAETAQAIFGTKVVTVSCMLEDRGMFITTRGWRPEETDPRVPRIHVGLEASICKYAMNKSEGDGCFVLPSARDDWRFAMNPYVREGGPINFFASANVNLPTLALENGRVVPSKLPIGSLCLVDPEARPIDSAMSEKDQKILKNLADLIAREFELGFERRRNAAAKAQTDYLGQLFRSLNMGPSTALADQEKEVFAHVAQNLLTLTSASYCSIIDLRSFHPSTPSTSSTSPQPIRRPSTDSNVPAVTPSTSFASAAPVYPTNGTTSSSAPIRPPLMRNASSESARSSFGSGSTGGSTNGGAGCAGAMRSHCGSGGSGAARSHTSQQREEEILARLSSRRGRRESDAGRFAVLDSAVAAGVELDGWSWEGALGIEGDDAEGGDDAMETEDEEEDARQRARKVSEKKMRAAEATKAVSGFLMDYYRSNQSHYDASSASSSLTGPLAPILPSGTTAYLAVPCFFDGDATLMVVLGSKTRHMQFEEADRDFVQNVGAVLVGSLLRRRLLEADKAKLHFLSQISHELRTPLHGIGSYLELIRDVADPQALATINPLLSMTDVCITSLREILDSVLSFSKLANADAAAALSSSGAARTSPSGRPTSAPTARSLVDLEGLIVDVVKSCWTTTLLKSQALKAVSDGIAAAAQEMEDKIDIILEYDLPRGTLVTVDVGALKRVLINLLGNSLKYTLKGKIVIAVSAPALASRSGVENILIDIADTGKGMSPEFVRERLFLPFSQEDPFKEGNGLGTAIADSLLRGMGGTLRYSSALGSGTTASIAVPLEINVPPTSDLAPPPTTSVVPSLAAAMKNAPRRPTVERRVLSDELSALLHPSKLGTPYKASPLAAALKVDTAPSPSPLATPSAPTGLSTSTPSSSAKLAPPFAAAAPLTPPLTPPVSAGPGILPSLPAALNGAPAEEPFTVLVADDNAIARRVLTTYLRTRRITVVEAENGAQAVEQYLSARPALVWMDIQMPGKDGLEATAEIRAVEEEKGWERARVVVISGLAKELGKHEQYLKSGLVDHWITKSGSLKALAADLEAYRSAISSPTSTASTMSAFPPPPAVTLSASPVAQAVPLPPVTA